MIPPDDYSERQFVNDRSYKKAWENAPEEFKKAAALQGLHPEVEERDGEALEYDPTRKDNPIVHEEDRFGTGSYTPDMAEILDTHIDMIVEEHADFFAGNGIDGLVLAKFIRLIADRLERPIQTDLLRAQGLMLGRAISYLISDENGNILSRIHAVMHALPRLSSINGFPSMRSSAKKCGVSPEWLRRSRDRACEYLGIDPPEEGVKSDAAKEKYRSNSLSNHWRSQKFKTKPKP